MKIDLFQILGWIGTFCILGAFFAVNFEILDSQNPLFPFFNAVGALFLSFDLTRKKAFPALFVEIVWAMIAIFALGKIILEK